MPASSSNVAQCIDLTVAQSDGDDAVSIIWDLKEVATRFEDLKEVATIIQDLKEVATRIEVIEELSRAIDKHEEVERVRIVLRVWKKKIDPLKILRGC